MNEIVYKMATSRDIDMLVNQRMLFSYDLGGMPPADADAMLRRQLSGYFRKEINKTYISCYAMLHDQVISIAGLHVRELPGNLKNPSGVWGYILNVFTMPEHRRKGLSKNVMERLMHAAAAEYGVTAFELHATEAGEPLYVHCGFGIHPEPTLRKFLNSYIS